MFERKNYKQRAREQLKWRKKVPALTTLFIMLIGAIFYSAFAIAKKIFGSGGEWVTVYNGLSFSAHYEAGKNSASLSTVLIIMICIVAALVMAQLCVHETMYQDDTRTIDFDDFFNGLGIWWKSTRATLWFLLWTHLWGLLFVIPGIVKGYSYSMMFFVIAENPKVGVFRAMKISKELTRGYKGELLMLDLSFLGWAILATIPAGLGWLWLFPYYNMTRTNAYHYLKNSAIKTGIIHEEDFN